MSPRVVPSRPSWLLAALLALGALALPASAQNRGEAARLFNGGRYEESAAAFRAVVDVAPQDAMSWFGLGLSLMRLERYAEAEPAFRESAKAGSRRAVSYYNLGCVHARLGERDEALDWLRRAIEAGFTDVAYMRDDEDLASLRRDAAFVRLLEYDPQGRATELDFWMGTWILEAEDGRVLGRSVIEPEAHGHVLRERWRSASGAEGSASSFFDPRRRAWTRVWIDAAGGVLEQRGELGPDGMIFVGERTGRDGRREQRRTTLVLREDGTVRHRIERRDDEEDAWTPVFDAIARRDPSVPEEVPPPSDDPGRPG